MPALERCRGAVGEVTRQQTTITGWDLDAGGGQDGRVVAELDVPPSETPQLVPLQG